MEGRAVEGREGLKRKGSRVRNGRDDGGPGRPGRGRNGGQHIGGGDPQENGSGTRCSWTTGIKDRQVGWKRNSCISDLSLVEGVVEMEPAQGQRYEMMTRVRAKGRELARDEQEEGRGRGTYRIVQNRESRRSRERPSQGKERAARRPMHSLPVFNVARVLPIGPPYSQAGTGSWQAGRHRQHPRCRVSCRPLPNSSLPCNNRSSTVLVEYSYEYCPEDETFRHPLMDP